jgi:pimeloyl-ACP methyl ester carboxylesterase
MPKVISRDGTEIGYELIGSGPLVITVAGATQYRAIDPEGTLGLARLLAPDFTVLVYDRRGRGESTDTWPYEVAREIEDIDALISANGGAAFLFGMSSGAVLALEATVALESRIKALALYEPPIDPERSSASYQADHAAMAALAERGQAGEMMARFMGYFMPPDQLEGFRQSPGWTGYEAVGLTIEHDYRILADARAEDAQPRRWRNCQTPVLILDGEASFPFMKAGADWIANGLPNATRKSLAGQTHAYDPSVLAPQLARFFKTA